MKKLALLLAVLLICASLASCIQNNGGDGDTLDIVCLSFPEYDWTRNIVGDREDVEIKLLRRGGVDLHSYQTTAADLMDIYESDLFVYIGSPSFSGFEEAVEKSEGNCVDLLSFFEGDELCGHIDDHEHTDAHHHSHGIDEHIWLSLSHSVKCIGYINALLCEIDPQGKEIYSRNSREYTKKLEDLDLNYRKTVESAETNVLVFADRYPFVHMANDYGLECPAAFSGCSGESSASFDTLRHLISSVEENRLNCVITLEGKDKSLARTVVSSVDDRTVKILTLNSMQAMGQTDIDNGIDYISVMENNLDVLKEALG